MVAMVFFESPCVRSWFPNMAGLEATGSLETPKVSKQVTGKGLLVQLVGGVWGWGQGEVRVLRCSPGWSYSDPCGSASQVLGCQASILLLLDELSPIRDSLLFQTGCERMSHVCPSPKPHHTVIMVPGVI